MLQAIFAGVMISLGGVAFLSVENKILGAFLFSIGLLCVILFKLHLYTGKVCDSRYYKTPLKLVVVWIGNFIGASLSAALMISHTSLVEKCSEVMQTKISKPLPMLCIDSIICGICIGIAVKGYNKAEGFGKYLMVILGIMTFILTGAEHCVADAFYMVLAHSTPMIDNVRFLAIVTLFNTVGGLIVILMSNDFHLRRKN